MINKWFLFLKRLHKFCPFCSCSWQTTLHLVTHTYIHTHTHAAYFMPKWVCTFFISNKLDVLWNSEKGTSSSHSSIQLLRGWPERPPARPRHLVSPMCLKTVTAPPPPDRGEDTHHKGAITHGEWPRLGSGATPKAKHLCIWIIYCTDSHICISGHFQVTGALWFTPFCQTVLLLVWNRTDIKLVWMQVPSWIFKAAV